MSVFFIFLSIVTSVLVILSIKLSIKTAKELSILRKSLSDNRLQVDKKPKKPVFTSKHTVGNAIEFELELTTPNTVNYSGRQKARTVGDEFTEVEYGVFEPSFVNTPKAINKNNIKWQN